MNILLDTTSNSKRNQVVTNVQKSQQQRLWPCTTPTNKATMFGQNGQIPHFLEIFSKKILFQK